MAVSRAKHLAVLGGVAAAYYVAASLGLRLAYLNPSATPVWAPSGIALAAFLVWGRAVWPAVFVAALLVNLGTAGNFVTSVSIAIGNTLEGVLGLYLVHRFAPGLRAFDHARDVFCFAVLTCGVATIVSATLGVGSLAVAGFAPWYDVRVIWLTWWLGDATGALVVTPALLLWAADPRPRWSRERGIEAATLAVGLLTMGQLVFGGVVPSLGASIPLEFLSVPVLLWAAMRFTPREAAAATLVLSAIAVRGTLSGLGPFARAAPNDSLLLVQSFMITSAATTLILAAVVAERTKAAAQLQRLSESDGLTGLANYRHMHEVIAREMGRYGRTKRPFALLLMDLNELKAINDRHGHLAGNRAICRVAEAMRASCRTVDTPARFGGDEFAVVLPETDMSEAWAVADRIHDRLDESSELPALALSVGVSEYPRDGATQKELLGHADTALYAMKRAARGEDVRRASLALNIR
jgi:diguanylate cyclase (GGDEF)-like protein